MWFPVDDGMVNLERVAVVRVREGLEVAFFNDHRAEMTKASFESEEQMYRYLRELKSELDYPALTYERERFPISRGEPLLEADKASSES